MLPKSTFIILAPLRITHHIGTKHFTFVILFSQFSFFCTDKHQYFTHCVQVNYTQPPAPFQHKHTKRSVRTPNPGAVAHRPANTPRAAQTQPAFRQHGATIHSHQCGNAAATPPPAYA